MTIDDWNTGLNIIFTTWGKTVLRQHSAVGSSLFGSQSTFCTRVAPSEEQAGSVVGDAGAAENKVPKPAWRRWGKVALGPGCILPW